MDLELAGSVPMDLDLEFGPVSAELELGGLSLTNLSIRTGASELVLEVSRPNPSEMTQAEFRWEQRTSPLDTWATSMPGESRWAPEWAT